MQFIIESKKKFDQGKEKMINKFGLKSFGKQFVAGIKSVS
jgi:hypothetical protein